MLGLFALIATVAAMLFLALEYGAKGLMLGLAILILSTAETVLIAAIIKG